MRSAEQIDRMNVSISGRNAFDMTATHDGAKKQALSVVEPVDFGAAAPQSARDFFLTLMLAHMAAVYFPKTIETNFPVANPEFLSALYNFYGFRDPHILKNQDQILISALEAQQRSYPKLDSASAHSGGLDSVYRVISKLAQGETMLAVHLQNLNFKSNFSEAHASELQSRTWGIPFENIKLKNASESYGYQTMRTRDMFLAGAVALQASPYQVDRIYIEDASDNDPTTCEFSEYTEGLKLFNHILLETGLRSQVEGVSPGDIETIREVLELEKQLSIEVIPLVQNCFSALCHLPNNRRKWSRVTPALAEASPAHWCGSCHKCRRMTLGRYYYQDPRFARIPQEEIAFFVKDTYKWIKENPQNADLLSRSFRTHLDELAAQLR